MKKIFTRQIYHLLSYIVLGTVLILPSYRYFDTGFTLLGLTTLDWIILSWIAGGLFQTWIVFFWRLEFFYGRIRRWFGKYGFSLFKTGFIILGLTRMLCIIPVSLLSRNTLTIPLSIKVSLIAITTPLIVWTLFSVVFYFGINRAFGADHFFPEYRFKPLERRGTFKYIPNSMYSVVLLLLYHPGIYYESSPGLLAALIHHLFVWAHYFCTEKPDMREIYGNTEL